MNVIVCCSIAINAGLFFVCFFFFQAEDGIRDLVRSRGLGDVYKRQEQCNNKRNNNVVEWNGKTQTTSQWAREIGVDEDTLGARYRSCLLYTSDAADDLLCVDIGGRRIIKKKNTKKKKKKDTDAHSNHA